MANGAASRQDHVAAPGSGIHAARLADHWTPADVQALIDA